MRPFVNAALMSLASLAICSSPAWAESSDGAVSVGVYAMNLLTIPAATELTLAPDLPNQSSRLAGTARQTDALVLSHNGANGLRLSVSTAADLMNLPNDISLYLSLIDFCALADLAPQQCIDHGAPIADVALPVALSPGGGFRDLIWSADASAVATPPGYYAWTITMTSTDM